MQKLGIWEPKKGNYGLGEFSFLADCYKTLCFHSGLCSGLCSGLWAGYGWAMGGLCAGSVGTFFSLANSGTPLGLSALLCSHEILSEQKAHQHIVTQAAKNRL